MPAVIAGNPFALIRITSDQPGGLVGLFVYRIAAGESCESAKLLTWGAADLRFHEGNFVGRDFPVGQPTSVRIDFEPIASQLGPGDRLATVLTHPGPYQEADTAEADRLMPDGPSTDGRIGQPYFPTLTIHAGLGPDASHLILPFFDGTMGGGPPTLPYPPRPLLE